MEMVSVVMDDRFMELPAQVNSMSKIRSGISPGYAPDILLDLVEEGLVEYPDEHQ